MLLEFVCLFIGLFIDLLKHFNRGICAGGDLSFRYELIQRAPLAIIRLKIR
jgi:hypothetical protein